MEESTCHELVIHLSQRFSSVSCLFYFVHFFISFKYDFHVGTEKSEKSKEIHVSASMVKKCMVRYLFRREELLIFVGYGQLN